MTILKADHCAVERMLTSLAESDEGSQRTALAFGLDAALTLHMEIEEDIVYPMVAEYVGEDDEEEAGYRGRTSTGRRSTKRSSRTAA